MQTFHGDGIFGTDIHYAVTGANSIATNQHTLNDAVRVTLKDRAIHECTRVTLVGITNDVLLVTWLIVGSFPLHSSGETCTTAATQAGFFHTLDDFHPIPFF